jgi:hypothetical protein
MQKSMPGVALMAASVSRVRRESFVAVEYSTLVPAQPAGDIAAFHGGIRRVQSRAGIEIRGRPEKIRACSDASPVVAEITQAIILE